MPIYSDSFSLGDRNVYTPEQMVEELAIPIVHKLLEELDYGFSFMSPQLKAFSVFQIKRLPDTMVELQEYGRVIISFTIRNCYYC